MPPGEQAGTLNVTVVERYLTVRVDLDQVAIDDRVRQYRETLANIISQQFAAEAEVTVTIGPKFVNASSIGLRRKLQVQGGGTDDLGECAEGYTSLTANIVVNKPIPQPQIEAVVAALPNNVLNTGNDQVYQCSASSVVYNDDLTRIPAPPSPPELGVVTVVWTTVWALLGLLVCCLMCCVIYGILAWRKGLYEEDDRDRTNFYESGRWSTADAIIYGKSRGFPFGRSAGEGVQDWGKRTLIDNEERH